MNTHQANSGAPLEGVVKKFLEVVCTSKTQYENARLSNSPSGWGKEGRISNAQPFFNVLRLLMVAVITIGLISCAPRSAMTRPKSEQDALLQFRTTIDHLLQDSLLHQTRTGIKIVSLDSGEVLYDRDSQQLFHPASNMKLLTTATALSVLGPNYTFRTLLLADSIAIMDSVVDGNLYLKGFGNPDLSIDDLRMMVHSLTLQGMSRITGDLICDDTYMDDLYWGSGWMWDDVSAWYWAPISALTVNDNCVKVIVKPGRTVGDSLTVQLEPPTRYMKIINTGITVDSLDTLSQKVFKVERKWKPPENTVVVEGGMPIGSDERTFIIDVVDAPRYVGTLFVELLQKEGIAFNGRVLKGTAPDSAEVLVEHLSPPLTLVIMNTNKISDNLSAELLLKTLGAEVKGAPGTAEKGLSVIRQFLDSLGIDSTTYHIADGSGVSRYNVVTPEIIVQLLAAMHEDFRIQAEFKTSLPIAGVDGTLKRRMKGSAAEGLLRAKTGSLRGVSSLSGYSTTADGEIVAFSIMMEHFVVSTSKIREIQDRIGHTIASFSRHKYPGTVAKH